MKARQLIQSIQSIIHTQWRCKVKIERIALVVLALALMLTLGVRMGQAQVQAPVPMSQPQQNSPAANVFDQISIQGRLTNASGVPLNGTYTVHFYVYDADVGGSLICGNWTTNIAVTNGLFNSTIDLCEAAGAFDGTQLYLGVQVGADPEMTPRQPLLPVTYAYRLRNGATIKGATTYVSVPGILFFKDVTTDTTRWDIIGGAARIYAGSATIGTRHIRIPITLPSVLYGQSVRVTSLVVYYRNEDGTVNYITETELYKQTDADSYISLINDTTHRTSNTATSYSLSTDTANYTFSANDSLSLRLGLFFNDDVHYVQIGGVRVTVVTNY